MKKAFVTGITGQDGSYLSELLLDKGYEVCGLIRRSSSFNTGRIEHLYSDTHTHTNLKLIYGDITDSMCIASLIQEHQPDEVYNLAAQSHVRVSFDIPVYSVQTNILGTLNLLEAIRKYSPHSKFYQASSSEMFGNVTTQLQAEKTPFHPRSPYGCSKVYSYWQTVNYREAFGTFACNGILFNHESPRRGETFVTRKITRAATRIKLGLQNKLYLGNLDAKRDWGFAGDYVEAMWLMMQEESSDDYVVATGETHSVREFLEEVFNHLELDWKDYVENDTNYYRPAEVDLLHGDAKKAFKVLGWKPKIDFSSLAKMMTDADMILAEKENILKKYGDDVNE